MLMVVTCHVKNHQERLWSLLNSASKSLDLVLSKKNKQKKNPKNPIRKKHHLHSQVCGNSHSSLTVASQVPCWTGLGQYCPRQNSNAWPAQLQWQTDKNWSTSGIKKKSLPVLVHAKQTCQRILAHHNHILL